MYEPSFEQKVEGVRKNKKNQISQFLNWNIQASLTIIRRFPGFYQSISPKRDISNKTVLISVIKQRRSITPGDLYSRRP